MKVRLLVSILSLAVPLSLAAQGAAPPSPSPGTGAKAPAAPSGGTVKVPAATPANRPSPPQARAGDLKAVLAQMNAAAAHFKSAQADFEWDQYQKVVNETDVQSGEIYFRRSGSGTDAAVRVAKPDAKEVVFSAKEGRLSLYQPKIDQVTEYQAGGNKTLVESFMSLGFGARGDDLLKNYEIKMDGWENVDGTRTARLDMVPKSEKVRASVNRVVLWIDPERNVSLKQQFFEPAGDYRLTHYTNIRLNARVPDSAFRLKTTSKTRVVRPQ